MFIGIVGWVILGLIVGFTASKMVKLRGDDPGVSIGLAAIAAVLGGWLYSAISGSAVSGFNVLSLLFAAVAATVAMVIWHALRRRSAHHA